MYSRALAIASIVCLMFSTSISSANEAFMNKCTAGAVSTGIAPADPMHFGLRLRGGVSRGELQQRAAEMRKKEGTAVKAAAVGLQGNPPEGGNDSSRGDNAVEKLKMEIGGENIELELSKIDSPVVLDGNEEMEVPSTLFLAASTGDAAAIESLLEHGASHAKVNDDGDTPLHIAAYHGHATAVAALCAGGASVDAPNQHGATPLHAAVASGASDAIPALLSANASTGAEDKHGYTPSQLARELGHTAAEDALGGAS